MKLSCQARKRRTKRLKYEHKHKHKHEQNEVFCKSNVLAADSSIELNIVFDLSKVYFHLSCKFFLNCKISCYFFLR